MSEQSVASRSAPAEIRASKSHSIRQSSVSRPTIASEVRSVHSRDGVQQPSTVSRKLSTKLASQRIQTKADLQGISPQRSAAKPSHHIGSTVESDTARRGPTLRSSIYASGQIGSTHTPASQISPRRAGLGARTISPVEIQRSRRNSQLIYGDLGSPQLAGSSTVVRKVSGIPSPVKPPLLSRSRPSPVPPIPALPNEISETKSRRSVLATSRENFRSVSGPAGSQRQRSVTLAATKPRHSASNASDEKSSFTSPMKKARVVVHTSTIDEAYAHHSSQPLTLPPMTVPSLSTPTIRRVNNMTNGVRSTKMQIENHPTQQSVEPVSASLLEGVTPDRPMGSRPAHSTVTSDNDKLTFSAPASANPDTSNTVKAKETNGFFSRLSLSRSSSRSRLKKKASTEAVNLESDTVSSTGETPERRRRMSLSWIKGKMSPFGSSSASIPRIDSGIPPSIPKSFTNESLASQLSRSSSIEKSTHDRASTQNLETLASTLPAVRPTTACQVPSTAPTFAANELREIADEEMRRQLINTKGSKHLTEALRASEALITQASARNPVDAADCSTLGDSSLNLYERGEAVDYDGAIYCTGRAGLKKIGGRLDSALNINFGYDDERGDYLVTQGDHFAYRYEIVDTLGKGSFGQVLRCIDYKTGGLKAVKVIRNKQRFHAQALVEVKILRLLRQWDPSDTHHLIKYTDHFHFRNHLCIVTDLLGMNLYEYLKANEFAGCTLNIIRCFTQQILSCLVLLKKQRIIHCDLKPENILLVNPWESKIKIIDFGSSCFEDQKVYTYIQSRFYRSPEVILGMSYGLPIDIWSMGCILVELFTGYPIFPGEDEQEQLACIMEIFGPPEKHLIEHSTRRKLFFDTLGKPRNAVSSKGRRRKPSTKTLSQAIKCTDEAFLDFLTKCLRWDPEQRLTPEDALEHPFITKQTMPSYASPKKARRFLNNSMTTLPPRTLAKTQTYSAGESLGKTHSPIRSTSIAAAVSHPTLGSPSKVHRRVVSSIPLPRERVVT